MAFGAQVLARNNFTLGRTEDYRGRRMLVINFATKDDQTTIRGTFRKISGKAWVDTDAKHRKNYGVSEVPLRSGCRIIGIPLHDNLSLSVSGVFALTFGGQPEKASGK